MIKSVFSAFIVGGLFAVLGQGITVMLISLMGADSMLIGPLTLLVLGLIGGILYIADIYPKIEKIGAFGAILPFSGLTVAIATVFAGTKAQSGSAAAAAKAAVSLVLYIVGTGFILCAIVGAVAFFTV